MKNKTKRYPMALYAPKVTLMSKEVADLVHSFSASQNKRFKPTYANIHKHEIPKTAERQ